jgi:hypothetical protein
MNKNESKLFYLNVPRVQVCKNINTILFNSILNYLIHSELIRIHQMIFGFIKKHTRRRTAEIAALPDIRILPHCHTLLHCRTAAHCRKHCHTRPCALPHTAALPHTV